MSGALDESLAEFGYALKYVGRVTDSATAGILSKLPNKKSTFEFSTPELAKLAKEFESNPVDIRQTLATDFEAVREEGQRGRASTYKRK